MASASTSTSRTQTADCKKKLYASSKHTTSTSTTSLGSNSSSSDNVKESTPTTTSSSSKNSKTTSLQQELGNYARKETLKTFEGSSIADNSDEYPKFDFSELVIGKVLGKGGFGTVSEVRSFQSSSYNKKNKGSKAAMDCDKDDETTTEGETTTESRAFIAQHCLRIGSGDSRYAIKILSPETINDPAMYLQGMIDMAIETRVLSSIEHPNIMKMRAVAKCDPFHVEYFIVMDRLYDTLEARLQTWSKQRSRWNGIQGAMLDRKGVKKAQLYEERIVKAFDLSAAFEYLHQKRIIYRDIKPENIGFDIRGDIKVFDFGLCKELRDNLKNREDGGVTYHLTEMTGSPRYMAPEVAMAKPYNETCDVYSFAILLWQMLSLQNPYEMYTMTTLREKVYTGLHKRPVLDDTWPNMIRLCLRRSWEADIRQRNNMTQVKETLRKEVVRIRNGNESGLEHYQRRSTFVFRKTNGAL